MYTEALLFEINGTIRALLDSGSGKGEGEGMVVDNDGPPSLEGRNDSSRPGGELEGRNG